jgi:polar amino acid transport system permease protein
MILSSIFDWGRVWGQMPELLNKLPITLELALVAMLISLVLGLLLAIVRIKKIIVLEQLAKIFLSIIRGTPMIIQLYVAYYGVPLILQAFGADNTIIRGIPKIIYAFMALGIYQSAFTSETIRAAFISVNKGEIEAAHAMGMTYPQILFKIIIPEAAEVAVPGLVNSLIGLIKGTSLAFACGVIEITAQAQIISGRTYRYLEGYVALAIIYWVITIIIERLLKILEKHITIPDQVDSNKQSKFKKFIYKVLKKKDIEKGILDEKDGDLDVTDQGVEEEVQQ